MSAICGANCTGCAMRMQCRGCSETGGSPFGGRCVAAEYIKQGGRESYRAWKEVLLREINDLLALEGLQPAEELHELAGSYINLTYTLPGGDKVRLLSDKNVYLGCMIRIPGIDTCYGVAADMDFILISRYDAAFADAEIVLYKKR